MGVIEHESIGVEVVWEWFRVSTFDSLGPPEIRMFKFLFIPRSEEFPGNCDGKDEDFDSSSWPEEYVKDDPWNDSESSNNC